MKIAVCIKATPDTESLVELNENQSQIKQDQFKWIINPYDEFAIEEAIQLKEKFQAQTEVFSLGPHSEEILRTALAMGIDEASHIVCENPTPLKTAFGLAQILKEKGFDLILCGNIGIDENRSQIPQMIAECMDIDHVSSVKNIECKDSVVDVLQSVGLNYKKLSLKLPCLLMLTKGINTPRYPSLPGIMKAKSKVIHKIELSSLLKEEFKEKIKFKKYELPKKRPPVQMIEGDAKTQAQKLVQLLREQSKVI